jgi:drug/metabolite transporter (DMT)-like permease
VEPPARGHYLLLGVAIASVSVSSTLLYLAREAPPLVISFYRLLFATLMLAVPAIVAARRETILLTLKDHAMLAGIGFLLAAHFATWVTSIFYTSIASSVVIVTTEALWVPLGAHFLLREHIHRRVWLGVAVAFAGSIVLLAGDLGETRFGPSALVGDFLAFAAALAASLYFLAGRRMRQRMGFFSYATIVYAWSTVFLFVFLAGTRGSVGATRDALGGYSAETLGWLFLFALIPMILGHSVINFILKWVQPHVVSTGILAEPVVSAILALVLFEQVPNPLVWLGGAVILVGILVATFRPSTRSHGETVTEPIDPPL